MSKRYFTLSALMVLLALAIGACGSSGSSDEEQISTAIRSAATGTDPAGCKQFETQRFMAQNTNPKALKPSAPANRT